MKQATTRELVTLMTIIKVETEISRLRIKVMQRDFDYSKSFAQISILDELEKNIQKFKGNTCPHQDTIDVGDAEHRTEACTQCEKIL